MNQREAKREVYAEALAALEEHFYGITPTYGDSGEEYTSEDRDRWDAAVDGLLLELHCRAYGRYRPVLVEEEK